MHRHLKTQVKIINRLKGLSEIACSIDTMRMNGYDSPDFMYASFVFQNYY